MRYAIILMLIVVAGCSDQSSGFALPPGDADAGETTFVVLRCDSCHGVEGVLDRSDQYAHPSIYVELGGEVTRVKTYGDLVSSSINPSHKFSRGRDPRNVDEQGESNMRRYNDEMTVQQLVDLTTFLARTYSVWSPQYVVHRYF